MNREELKNKFLEQNTAVQAETRAFLQGYDQALLWALNMVAPEETKPLKGPTVIVPQEK